MAWQEALYPQAVVTRDAIPFHLLNESIVGNIIKSFCKIHYYYVCLLVTVEVVDSVLNKGEELSFCGYVGAEAMLKVIEDANFFWVGEEMFGDYAFHDLGCYSSE